MSKSENFLCRHISVCSNGGIQTSAFQKAIDEVWSMGGGTVEVSKGDYLIGSIRLRSNVTLHLLSGAHIFASRKPEDYDFLDNDVLEPIDEAWCTQKCWEPFVKGVKRCYDFMKPGGRWNHGIIRAVGAENVSIIAEKDVIMDGQDCYDEKGEECYRGPHGISMQHCRNVKLSGYIICNTGNWAHCLTDCENIFIDGIRVLGGHDGVHFTSCIDNRIQKSEFYTGDDCIAGFGNINTLVTECICNTACSGLRFGGTNALIEKCKFFGPAKYFFRGSLSLEEKKTGAKAHIPHRVNMLSVFTYYADFSVEIPEQPGNIVITDCMVENVDRFLHYNFSGNERWQSHRPLSDIKFNNIVANGISKPLTAYGSPDMPINLTMKNMTVAFKEDVLNTAFLHTANYEMILLENLKIQKSNDAPLIKTWTKGGNVKIHNVEYNCEEQVKYTEEPFVCKSI